MSYQARVSKRGRYVVVEIPRVLKPDPMCISHQASGQERCLVLLNHFIYTGIFSAFWPVCSERDLSYLSLLWARVVSVDVMLLYWHYVFKAAPHASCLRAANAKFCLATISRPVYGLESLILRRQRCWTCEAAASFSCPQRAGILMVEPLCIFTASLCVFEHWDCLLRNHHAALRSYHVALFTLGAACLAGYVRR